MTDDRNQHDPVDRPQFHVAPFLATHAFDYDRLGDILAPKLNASILNTVQLAVERETFRFSSRLEDMLETFAGDLHRLLRDVSQQTRNFASSRYQDSESDREHSLSGSSFDPAERHGTQSSSSQPTSSVGPLRQPGQSSCTCPDLPVLSSLAENDERVVAKPRNDRSPRKPVPNICKHVSLSCPELPEFKPFARDKTKFGRESKKCKIDRMSCRGRSKPALTMCVFEERVADALFAERLRGSSPKSKFAPLAGELVGKGSIVPEPSLDETSPSQARISDDKQCFAVSAPSSSLDEQGTPDSQAHHMVIRPLKPTTCVVLRIYRCFGVLPWSSRRMWFSVSYQLLLFCGASASVTILAMKLSNCAHYECALERCIDLTIALGGLLALLAVLVRNKSLIECNALSLSYCELMGVFEQWEGNYRKDMGCVLIVWLLCFILRLYDRHDSFDEGDYAFGFGSLLFLVVCSYLLRSCRCFGPILDAFCESLESNNDFTRAILDWHMFHCFCRRICSTIQLCFLLTQLTTFLVFVFILALVMFRGLSESIILTTIFPDGCCIVVTVYISLRAASLTDKCYRLPSLVNHLGRGHYNDEHANLVNSIYHSNTGFYIYDMRLSSEIMFKVWYSAGVGIIAILTNRMGIRFD